MEIRLTKHVFGDLTVQDNLNVGVFGPKCFSGNGLADHEVRQQVASPIGTAPLRELARGKRNVVVITDDNTRATPLPRILPVVINELQKAGVRDEEITFLVGLGTHRPMNKEEINIKFSPQVSRRYRILNHAWDDPNQLVSIGACQAGFDVVVNRLALEADLLVGIGTIVPHATAGFSGGGKIIMPGVCGEKTLEDTHWKALDFSMKEILGCLNNPVQRAILDVARKVGLDFIINCVLFGGDRIHQMVAGDVQVAHQLGVEACRRVYGVPVPAKARIVIAEAFPTDIDLRQSIKAICAADIVCEDGGVIILPAECREGVAPQFPDFRRIGFSNPDKLYQEVEDGIYPQKLLAYTLVAIGRIISERVTAILVSPNIEEQTALELGMLWAQDLSSAYTKARRITGENAPVMTLLSAGEILPTLSEHC